MENKKIVKFRRVKIKKKSFITAKFILFVFLGILFIYFIVSVFNEVNPNAGYVISEEQQENRIATIRAIIEINNAEHLNSERQFISDITNEIKESDGIWSEKISDGEYVRVIFEQPLNSKNDITIYPRIVNRVPKIEVYEKDGNEIIAEFSEIVLNDYNKILLTNLIEEQDTFDLRIAGGSIEIEQVFDPVQGVKK